MFVSQKEESTPTEGSFLSGRRRIFHEKRPNGVSVRSETEIRALFRRGRGETQFRRKFFCLLFFQEK